MGVYEKAKDSNTGFRVASGTETAQSYFHDLESVFQLTLQNHRRPSIAAPIQGAIKARQLVQSLAPGYAGASGGSAWYKI